MTVATHGGWTPATVLVGVDGGPGGRAALGAALADAEPGAPTVLAVHVRRGLSPVEALGSAFAGTCGAWWLDCRDDSELSAWLDCVQLLEAAGVRWRFLVREGDPAVRLAEVAAEHHVGSIYLATRPRPWWARGFHHCPARALARHSSPPIRLVSYAGD